MAEKDVRLGDLLTWSLPAVGLGATLTAALRQEGWQRLWHSWARGRQITMAIESYMEQLAHQRAQLQMASTALPDWPQEWQEYVLELARHRTGTQQRLRHITSFAEVENLRTQVPEFYEQVQRLVRQLAEVDLSQVLTGEALTEALPPLSKPLTSYAYVKPARLAETLEQLRPTPEFTSAVLQAKEAFESAVGAEAASVYLIRHPLRTAAGTYEEGTIGLRFAAKGRHLELPVLTPEGAFVTSKGATFIPSWWMPSVTQEIPPDVYIAQKVAEFLREHPTREGISQARELVTVLRGRSVHTTHQQELEGISPIALEWLRARGVVPWEQPQDIARLRERILREAEALQLDLTTGTPAQASATGMVFRPYFDVRRWTLAGGVADDKAYKTFARPLPLSREALERLRGQGKATRAWSHLLYPAAVPQGYYETARQSGERLLTLRYGLIEEEIGGVNVLQALEEMLAKEAKGDLRRRWFLQTSEDELFLAAPLRRYFQSERMISYRLDPQHGLNQEILEGLLEGRELPRGTYLGADPMGRPVFSGRRGGREFLADIEHADNLIHLRVRNVITPEVGTKIFGTGGIKHTVRAFIEPRRLQRLYAYYLTRFKGLDPAEAQRLAQSVNALALAKGFKTPEQEVEQYLAALADLEGIWRQSDPQRWRYARNWLQRFGFQPAEEEDLTLGRWVRRDYRLSPEEIYDIFRQEQRRRPQGVLAEAMQRAQLVRSELIRMGPPKQDLGVGQPATFAREMLNRLLDQQRLTKTAMHVLARTGEQNLQTMRGLAEMLEPFWSDRIRYGTHISELPTEALRPGEYGVADLLARWSDIFPPEGIIHFRPYELPGGKTVSWVKISSQAIRELQGVWLEDGRNAASIWQRAFYDLLQVIQEDQLSRPGSESYRRAVEALVNYQMVLGNLTLGKSGAAREVMRGRVAHSLQLQAASLPQGLMPRVSMVGVRLQDLTTMLKRVPEATQRELVQQLYPGRRYTSLLEALRAGETLPALMMRYPAANIYNVAPVELAALEPRLEALYRSTPGLRGKMQLAAGGAYVDPNLFKIMIGDFDADVAHVIPILEKEAAEEVQKLMEAGVPETYIEQFERLFTDPAIVKQQKQSPGWTNTLEQRLGRLVQQQAGKADVGVITNALEEIVAAARRAGHPEWASWTPIIMEAMGIKAKHTMPAKLLEIHKPAEMIAHLRGTGLGMDLSSRVEYITSRLAEVVSPENLPFHRENVQRALEAYDQQYRQSSWRYLDRLLRRLPGQTRSGEAEGMLRWLRQIFQDLPLEAHLIRHAVDEGGWRTRLGARLAPLMAAGQELATLLKGKKHWAAWGLAGGIGLGLMRRPRQITPEGVTGEEVPRQTMGLTVEEAEEQVRLATPPAPTARVTPRGTGTRLKVRGRVQRELVWTEVGERVEQATQRPSQVWVHDLRRRYSREDLRRWQRQWRE